MPARSSRLPFAWTMKSFEGLEGEVLPARRRLAEALQGICRHLAVTTRDGARPAHPTQADAARYLNVSETALSRYLQGQRIPPETVAALIYDIACRDAGGSQNIGMSRSMLLKLRLMAEQERCASCSRHRDAARAAGQKLRALQEAHEQLERSAKEQAQEVRELRQHAAALKQEAQRLRTAQPMSAPSGEAGLQKVRTAAHTATLLPVPRRHVDRQQSKNETLAALNVGRRAEELLRGGRPDSTLALVRHTAEAYTPVEVALLVALLRTQEQDGLADNLVHIYARDRDDQDVVQTALTLHEQKAVTDAEALLRTAAAYPGTALSRAEGAGSSR